MLELSPSMIIYTIINLLILYFLLRKFLFKPVTNMIESRQAEIEHNLAAAEDQRIHAEAMLEDYNIKLKDAAHEAGSIVARGKQMGEQEYQSILTAAQRDAKRLSSETELQLAHDREAMLTGVRREVASLAILAAAHVSAHERSAEADEALLDVFLAEVGERT